MVKKLTGKAIRTQAGGNPVGKWLTRAITEGIATLEIEGGRQLIRYGTDHSENYDDPEEWVRADLWAELIYHYKYAQDRIGIEVPVPDRVPGDFADLVIYRDDAKTLPYAVIETKAETVTDAEFEQAVEQVFGNATWAKLRADYVAVAAGGARRRIFDVRPGQHGIGERAQNVVADLPVDYAEPATYRFRKAAAPGDPDDIAVASKEDLIKVFRKCHDTLWSGGQMDPSGAFGELCKLLFVKIFDERKGRLVGDPYEVQVKTGESAKDLADRIAKLYNGHRQRDPDIFTSELNIAPATLKALIEQLQALNINESDVDAKGVAFEIVMGDLFKGKLGQYFTPRDIVRFAVEMLDVSTDDWVIDPACGSGGFLLHALEIVREKAKSFVFSSEGERDRSWHDFALTQLFGIELSENLARVAKMNMILHGDGHSNVVYNDALDKPAVLLGLNPRLKMAQFDLLLTNVPFGSQIKQEEKTYPIGDFTALGNTSIKTKTKGLTLKPRKAQKSEILFLERIWQLLKPATGRAAVIIPDGILTNGGTGYVRDFLFTKFHVLAIVSLPVEAFTHYGANVKSSIIFLRKLGKDEATTDSKPVFLAEAASVGHDATGRPAPNQLIEVLAAYRVFQRDPAPVMVEIPKLAGSEEQATEESPEGDEEDE